MPDDTSSQRSILKGSAFSVAGRWILRSIGLVSTIVLARLLTPEDFGIVAMLTVVVGLLQAFSDFGVNNLILRSQDRSDRFVDTGWTIQVLQGVFLALLLYLISSIAASYFDEPKVELVLQVGALSLIIAGFRSAGHVLARKDLRYAADLQFLVIARVMSFTVNLGLALWLRSYWALVIGHLIGTILTTALTYVMFPRRVRWCLTESKQFLKFAVAAIPLTSAKFLTEKMGTIVVGGTADTAKVGLFNVSHDLSNMATAEVLNPIGRVLIPNYAKLGGERDRLRTAFLYSFQLMLTLALPAAVGLSAVAEPFVAVVLGSQWVGAGELVQWLALYAFAIGIVQVLTMNILIAIGREHLAAGFYWLRLLILATVMVVSANLWDVLGMSIAATVTAFLFVPVALIVVSRLMGIGPREWAVVGIRPLTAVAVMWLLLVSVEDSFGGNAVALAAMIPLGAAAYVTSVLSGWWLAGRPEGVERSLLGLAKEKLGRLGGVRT